MVNVLELPTKQRHELEFEVERGPDWLFVRLPDLCRSDLGRSDLGRKDLGRTNGKRTKADAPGENTGLHVEHLADHLWNLLNQHFIYRLVLEMEQVSLFSSSLMGQLVMLQKRVLQHDGALRLCGLSPQCQQALHICRLDQVMPNYHNRADAVHGCAWSKPR